jgi:hypothetical protein
MHTRAYAIHIPTPSRTRRTHSHPLQHSTSPAHHLPTAQERSSPAWARNLARTPAATRVSGTAPANTNTSKASQPPANRETARNTSSRYPRTLTRPRSARRAGWPYRIAAAPSLLYGSRNDRLSYPTYTCVRARARAILGYTTYLPCAIYLCCAGYRVALNLVRIISRLGR